MSAVALSAPRHSCRQEHFFQADNAETSSPSRPYPFAKKQGLRLLKRLAVAPVLTGESASAQQGRLTVS